MARYLSLVFCTRHDPLTEGDDTIDTCPLGFLNSFTMMKYSRKTLGILSKTLFQIYSEFYKLLSFFVKSS